MFALSGGHASAPFITNSISLAGGALRLGGVAGTPLPTSLKAPTKKRDFSTNIVRYRSATKPGLLQLFRTAANGCRRRRASRGHRTRCTRSEGSASAGRAPAAEFRVRIESFRKLYPLCQGSLFHSYAHYKNLYKNQELPGGYDLLRKQPQHPAPCPK